MSIMSEIDAELRYSWTQQHVPYVFLVHESECWQVVEKLRGLELWHDDGERWSFVRSGDLAELIHHVAQVTA